MLNDVVELERRQLLELQVESWTKAQQVRAFVDAVERRAQAKDKSMEPGTELAEWIAWARRHADRLDPLKSPGPEDIAAGSQPGE